MKKPNSGILTFPIGKAGIAPLSNLIDVLYPLTNHIYLITGNAGYDFFKGNEKIHTYGIRHKGGSNVFTRIMKYTCTQLRISYKLAKIGGNVDIWIFSVGGDILVLPMLTAKILRKKIVLAFANSSIQSFKSANDNFFKLIEILSKITCALSDRIIVYSENLVKEFKLRKYRKKILIAPRHFVNLDEFKMTKQLNERENLIGYIGRLTEEKGVLNFVKAIPRILKQRDDLKFLVGGDGQLRDEIERYLKKENLEDKVKFTGWIRHDDLPKYLNNLKLIVIPSYTEAGPLILFEAMACGTPAIATLVGSVPDLIEDGKTGFILKNNSSECIAENVIRVLEHPNLDEITKNARNIIEEKYTYEAAVERYRKILENI